MKKIKPAKLYTMPLLFVQDHALNEKRDRWVNIMGDCRSTADFHYGYFVGLSGDKVDVCVSTSIIPYSGMFGSTSIKMPKFGDVYIGIFDLEQSGCFGLSDGVRFDIAYDGYMFTGRVDDKKSFNCRKSQNKVTKTDKIISSVIVSLSDEERKELTDKYAVVLKHAIDEICDGVWEFDKFNRHTMPLVP
jgi:hypothetical protein